MKKLLAVALAMGAFETSAADVGDVAVIEDTTGDIHSGFALQQSFCRETAKKFLATHSDEFDGLMTFTTAQLDDIQNTQQGTPVIWNTQGIGQTAFDHSAQYGSNHKLSQCVFMGSLGRLPQSPDGQVTVLFGLPLGLTGAELMGHEYGHHWLLWTMFDKGDGLGARHLLRGYESGSPNGHYNHFGDSGSVMYGSFITDHKDGTFTLAGGDRKYSPFDQYLMGLRAPSEVPDTFIVDDGSGEGSPSVPLKKGSTAKVSGVRVDVAIADVIRAMGPRVPDSTTAQKCWRVAFVLAHPAGQPPTAADLAKLEAYRARFKDWFSYATDQRGTMDLRLAGNGCASTTPPPQDAGVPVADAGVDMEDAGVIVPDAGAESEDAGAVGSGGVEADGGFVGDEDELGTLRPGCGCSGSVGAGVAAPFLVMIGALRFRWRRRR